MQGKVMSIKGSIFSTHTIESVTGGIYKAEDSDCDYNDDFVFTIEGGRKSFNLSLIDNDIVFNQLPVGEYVYKVAVTDVNGYTKEVINSTFRIRSSEQSDELQQAVMKGIDVSELNGDIDWEKVYADGIDFAVIRAGMTYNGDANYHQDSNFEKNYEGAKNAGLKIGAYLYTSAINKSEMKADIEGLIKTLEGKSLDMPVYIDFETNRQTSLNKQALTEIAAYGCQLLSENGYKAGVYTSYNWFRDYIDMAALNETDCEIWLAFWPNDASTVNMSDFCVTWQYCSDGTVKGITGDVDGDYRYAALSLESYALNIVQPETGTIKTDKDKAFYGERVTVSAELDRTHRLKSVKYNGTEASYNGNGTFSFSMPENEVEITTLSNFIPYLSNVTQAKQPQISALFRKCPYLSEQQALPLHIIQSPVMNVLHLFPKLSCFSLPTVTAGNMIMLQISLRGHSLSWTMQISIHLFTIMTLMQMK